MNPYSAYAAATMMTDEHDKGKILLTVLETLTRKIEEVKMLIAQKKYEKKYEELTRIVQALQILDASLDMSLGEIPKNLSLLYGYLMRRLRRSTRVSTRLPWTNVSPFLRPYRRVLQRPIERRREKTRHCGRC